MTVVIKSGGYGGPGGRLIRRGETVTVDDAEARRLIAIGAAVSTESNTGAPARAPVSEPQKASKKKQKAAPAPSIAPDMAGDDLVL